eukprot:CAMPEP_0172815292 /NCGR_PEP_ID=MMETSP1075-20121228/11683_1 /TAXON_ID=2916 /ORGANISM="Ceratium fusus, Strain PA161109" /LENGTH=510 /DNA_ID=CAMNT_0013655129 /DNA_START=38 /DNA_END=1567 /DNA_ORIENTATION=-
MRASAWPCAAGQLAACLLWSLISNASCHESSKTVCHPWQGHACKTRSAVMVQTKLVRQRSNAAGQELKETENSQRSEVREGFGSTVKRHGAFAIRTFDTSHVFDGGARRWILTVPEGCDGNLIKQLTEDCKPANMIVDYAGNPDNGGMCTVILTGTEAEIMEDLGACKNVLSESTLVEADAEMHLIPDDESTDEDESLLESGAETTLWGLDRIDDRTTLDSDYTPPNTGKNVHVFVADTGILTTHADFEGRAIPTLEALSAGRPKVCNPNDRNCAKDRQGHGTHCAATIGGKKYGVAKEVKLHAVKVLSDRGSGSFSWFITALDWVEQARDKRPAVFSASLGGRAVMATVRQAIDDATNAGVMVVVAAGNDGRTQYPDACSYTPAHVPSAITVGSMTRSDSRSIFSNYGSCLDIFAPGSDIKSAGIKSNTDSATLSGTSMACPHVSGAAALLFEANPTKSVKDVERLLLVRATRDMVKDTKAKTPNLLLFVGKEGGPRPTPVATPKPTRA